eukprot:g2786.t1
MASPTVPGAEVQKVSFSSSAVPVTAVTVFKDRAQIHRKLSFSAATRTGLHEVELTELPSSHLVEDWSLAVKGIGQCTILDVSFLNTENEAKKEEQRKELEEVGRMAEEMNSKIRDMTAAKLKNMDALKQEHAYLASQFSRNERLRHFADRVAEGAAAAFASPNGPSVGAPGQPNQDSAAAAAATQGSMDIDGVSKALDWWEKKSAEVDEECHRLRVEGERVQKAMKQLEDDHVSAVSALQKENRDAVAELPKSSKQLTHPDGFSLGNQQKRVVVTVDVEELKCPIELEVSYMTGGATWSPAYDLRVDTQTDSMSCIYYGIVSQRTSEDWEGVALKLSTAEPSARSTPPTLGTKTVSLKPAPAVSPPTPSAGHVFGATSGLGATSPFGAPAATFTFSGAAGFGARAQQQEVAPAVGGSPFFSAPPPPPEAKSAVAEVEGGRGSVGAVTFAVDKPATIRKEGETKKFSVGVLQLNAEVVHYIVPSKEPSAYLQAKATNNTDYLLLASEDVSVFFDKSFVAKTNLTSVSPGESFQTFLGTDPAVKIKVAPPRKTAKQRGIFGKVDHVHCTQSTSISNTKKVPVTCVLVDALPRSTDDIVKVTLLQPAQGKVSEAAEAINDEMLVDVALDMFGGEGGAGGDVASKVPTTAPKAVKTSVAGVAKGPLNHLAWVVKIAPSDDISIPLEYTVEWPIGKEPKLIEDPQGMLFEYVDQDEAEFLYEEVFVRRSYLQHGLLVEDGAVVIDAGANIGIFSLHCLREAKGVQIHAFEPIPANYGVLVRNLYNTSSDSVKAGTCPQPVALRVALGAEQGDAEFYFFEDNPGESTRHFGEREEQRQALKADPDAASWRQTLGPQTCAPPPKRGIRSSANMAVSGAETRQTHNQKRKAQAPDDPSPGGGKELVATGEDARAGDDARAGLDAREEVRGRKRGVSFSCSVVPLSLAIQQLDISNVDLLKVDVEGDELAVLHGIDDDHWPKIRQIALEVHDVDGRLAATVSLLRSQPAAFDEVCWEPQLTSEVSGYVMVVPKTLRMFLVYAKRRRQQPAKLSSTGDASAIAQAATRSTHGRRGGGGCSDSGNEDGGAVETCGRQDTAAPAGVLSERFCSCAPVNSGYSVLPT